MISADQAPWLVLTLNLPKDYKKSQKKVNKHIWFVEKYPRKKEDKKIESVQELNELKWNQI